jgi:hypothetical protein
MSAVIDAAIAKFKSEGLHAAWRDPSTLFIAATVLDTPLGVSITNDATFLIDQGHRWLGVFPARGQCTHEVPGTLEDLTDLTLRVYANYHESGGQLWQAFTRVVPAHARYLTGAANPASVRDVKSA